MAISSQLLAAVQAAEGLRTVAYKDTLGNWTIGYGHLLAPGKDWQGYAISKDTALGLLTVDLNAATMAAARLNERPSLDTPARQDAHVELVFNMGPSKWSGFVVTRKAIMDQRWEDAHDGLLLSVWAKEVGPDRSNRLANMLLSGTYPE